MTCLHVANNMNIVSANTVSKRNLNREKLRDPGALAKDMGSVASTQMGDSQPPII